MLPKKNRIPRSEFPDHKVQGFRVFLPLFTAVFYKSTENKASIVVSKKTAKKAVSRNLIRRRFYEALAPLFKKTTTNTTVVIYPKKEAEKVLFSTLKSETEKALKQAKLL